MRRRSILIILLGVIVGIHLTLAFSTAQPKHWPRNITIGTGSIGGVAYLHGAAVAKVIYEKMGISSTAEVTGGSVHNVKLANAKEVTFGKSHALSAYEGWNGIGWAKGTKYQDIRAMFHEFDVFFQIYALKKSGIKSIYDLNGRSLGVGPIGGGPHVFYPQILEGLGIKPSRYVNAGISDLDTQLRDGLLDANANIIGKPWVMIKETETVHELNVFGIAKKEFEKIPKLVEKYPFVTSRIIPKGTYKANRDFDIETLTIGSFYYVHKDTPEDFVYEVLKTVCENWDTIAATVAASRGERPERIVENSPIPLHPGAIKYFKEKGIKVPDRLVTPK